MEVPETRTRIPRPESSHWPALEAISAVPAEEFRRRDRGDDGLVSEPTPTEGRLDRQRGGVACSDRRRCPGRRGTAPEEGAPRPACHPDPARFRRVGQSLPRLRLAGRRRSVRLLRRLARLVGGLRANPTLPAPPGHATPRHPVDDDCRADAGRRVPSFRRGRVVGHPGSARSPRLPRGASGCPLVRCVPHGLPAHGRRGRGAVLGRGSPGLVHEHDAGVERHRYCLRRLHTPRFLRPPAQRGAYGTPSRAGEV